VSASTEVARAGFHEIATLIERLRIETEIEEGTMKTDVMSIMENILRAESEEEVLARQEAGTVASQDYTYRVFFLDKNGIDWKTTAPQYREQGAFPFYALLRVRDAETDKEIVVSAGGATCVAVLDRLVQLGSLNKERALMFVEKPVSSGFSVLLLKPVAMAKSAKQ
jgi:hypothetical protein